MERFNDPYDAPGLGDQSCIVPDPYAPARAAAPRRSARAAATGARTRPGIWRRLLLGVALLALATGGTGAASYLLSHRGYQPTAHRHVPAHSLMALRADGAEIMRFEPVRQHLWPLVTKRGASAATTPTGAAEERIARIRQLTGIRIPEDLREVVVASTGLTSWVILVGGTFDADSFVPGMEQLFREERLGGWGRDGRLLAHLFGPTLAQAEDGTIIVGTDATIVRAALSVSSPADQIPLPVQGAVSFHASARAWSAGTEWLPLDWPGFSTLGHVSQVSGSITLSEQPQLNLRLTPQPGIDASALRTEIDQILSTARMLSVFVPDSLREAKSVIVNAKVEARDGTT